MRTCAYCGQLRPDEAFEVCRVVKGKAYRRGRCQSCKREVTQQRIEAVRDWLEAYKADLKCARCGFGDYRALDFHHDSGNKRANVADMVHQGLCADTLRREIEKCSVLCANCHRIEHYGAPRSRRT